MRGKIISPIICIIVLSLLLVSCWQSTPAEPSQDTQTIINHQGAPDDQQSNDNGLRGTDSGPHRGGGRFGSGSEIFNKLTPEDRVVLNQIMDARKAGNTDFAKQLQEQLKKKYPDIKFGGGRKSGSGSLSHSGSWSNSGTSIWSGVNHE